MVNSPREKIDPLAPAHALLGEMTGKFNAYLAGSAGANC
jgi:hypothetical protein